MIKIKKIILLILLIFNFSFIKADEIKIGISTFLSGGAASSFGIPLKQGLEFMFKAINEGSVPAPYNTPGIAGKKISFFFIDESGGSTKQVAEFRNMVQRQKVDVVMGYISSGDCLSFSVKKISNPTALGWSLLTFSKILANTDLLQGN